MVGDVAALKITPLGDIEQPAEPLGVGLTQHLGHLLRRPEISCAFPALAVGIQCRGKCPTRQRHLPLQPLHDAPRRVGKAAIDGASRLGIGRQQHGVVVEHLLEVRHQPAPIGAVAAEAPAYMVEYAASGHSVQRAFHHGVGTAVAAQQAISQQKQQVMRRWKLGRATKAAVAVVEALLQHAVGHINGTGVRPAGLTAAAQVFGDGAAGLPQALPVIPPQRLQCLQHLGESRRTISGLFWKVSACVKGPPVVVQKAVERPATLPGHGHACLHVQMVHIRALLAVHFDADKALV